MTQPSTVTIATTDRACFFGHTGSGKTTLAKAFLRGVRAWVVLDPKHTFTFDRVKARESFSRRETRQIIRAPFPAEDWSTPMLAAWRAGHRVIYVDETTLVNPSEAHLNPTLGRVIRTGRELGVGCWMASQRPKKIPSEVFTEADHIFAFRLKWEEDRKRVGEFTDERVYDLLHTLRGHEFVYFNTATDYVGKFTLNLGG